MNINRYICQKCHGKRDGVEYDPDIRCLVVECFYDLQETGIPFYPIALTKNGGPEMKGYGLNFCKKCRADFIQAMKVWFESKPPIEPQTGYFVRHFGTNVQIRTR